MKLVFKKKLPLVSMESALGFVEQAKARGITAREIARKLGVDAMQVQPRLYLLESQRAVWSHFTPCPDWRDHFAVQENRYYLIDVQAQKPDDEDPRPKRKLNEPKPKLVLRRS